MGFTCQPTVALVSHYPDAFKVAFVEGVQQNRANMAVEISSFKISRKQTDRSLEHFVVRKVVASVVFVEKTGIHQLFRATQLQVLQFRGQRIHYVMFCARAEAGQCLESLLILFRECRDLERD